MSHGTFGFMSFNGYGWYLSSTAALLYCSYFTHNVVAWMKIAPFFTGDKPAFRLSVCKWVRWVYLSTLALTAPALIFEIYNNFRFFNNISELYKRVRPYEPLMRDPWWLFSCLTLFHIIRKCYNMKVFKMIQKSPRFGILLVAILLAIIFTIMDILASIVSSLSETDGINPYWKLSVVFKCLTDNIMLDDFKSVLQRLGAMKLDGMDAMGRNSMNLPPNEKAGYTNDDYDVSHVEQLRNRSLSNHSVGSRGRQRSFSGRLLDDGEYLDDDGRARRKQSLAVGKLGVKIHRLPRLPFSRTSRTEREAEFNAQRNRNIQDLEMAETGASRSEASSNDTHEHSHDNREPWEQVDFITAVTDQSLESPRWKR
jgi:hypothetical protein